MPVRRSPPSPWSALRRVGRATYLVLVLLASAGAAFLLLLQSAERQHLRSLELAEIEAGVQRMSAIEWRAAAERRVSPEVGWAYERARRALSHSVSTLEGGAATEPGLAHVLASYRDYMRRVDEVLGLLRAGRTEDAEAYDERRVDPAFDELASALASARRDLAGRIGRTRRWLVAGVSCAGLVALVSITVLALQATRTRSRAETAEAHDRESRASAELYRELFDLNPQPMAVVDPRERRFLAVNEAALQIYGYSRESFLARGIEEIGPGLAAHLDDAPRQGTGFTMEPDHLRRDGARLAVEVAMRPVVHQGQPAMLVAIRDRTEQTRLEQRMREARRLETMGRLANGVAHDFNNLVTATLGYAQLLIGELTGPNHARAREHAHDIWKAARRASALTRHMLDLGRASTPTEEPVRLGALLRELQPMLARLLGEDVSLHLELDTPDGRVRGERTDLEQVVLRLTLRARDAMPRGGQLTFAVRDRSAEGPGLATDGTTIPEGCVDLIATDTGGGAGRTALGSLTSMTTEPAGRDPALDALHELARGLDADLAVETLDTGRTTVRVRLRAAESPPTPLAHVLETETARVPSRATLLLVEDDAAVRDVVRLHLEDLGHEVLECGDAKRAVEVAGAHPGPIDLLISDVVLPGMNGRELAEALAPRRPEMRVLLMSGFTEDAVLRRGILENRLDFLPKPFEAGQLAERVRDILARPRAAA